MKPAYGRAALCAILTAALGPAIGAAQAQDLPDDPLTQGRVLELSFGLFAPVNGLQDSLTTPNGGGTTVNSTDVLSFGPGGRVQASYSQPWGETARLIVSLTGAQSAGDATLGIGALSESFPGSYDDGFNLPANWTVDTEIETKATMLSIGREWALNGTWRVSAGLQGGTASQDFFGILTAPDGELWRSITTESKNRMYGVFGGVSHYSALGEGLGLRLSGNLGVMQNQFDYRYVNVLLPGDISPSGQEISGSASGTAVSARLSARLEKQMSDRGLLTFEVGYEGLYGVGSGADTFLDPDGTDTTAAIDGDRIGAGYISVGYAFRF